MKIPFKPIYNPPKLIRSFYKNVIWESKKEKILFTFDDGPIPETTELILNKLNEYNIKSVFFCVGENIKKYPNLIEKILSEGHSIGNHTFTHKRLTSLNENIIQNEIELFQKEIFNIFGYEAKYFRPPHGRLNNKILSIAKKLDLQTMMWSLLTYDYKNDLNILKFAVKNYIRKNSIIVLHDSLKSCKIILDSIDFIYEEIRKRNYKTGNIEECLK